MGFYFLIETYSPSMGTFKDIITINNQKVFKRVMNYECMRIIHYDSSLYLLLQSLIYKKTADSAHCSVIYFAIFSSSISHCDVIYLIIIRIKAIFSGQFGSGLKI